MDIVEIGIYFVLFAVGIYLLCMVLAFILEFVLGVVGISVCVVSIITKPSREKALREQQEKENEEEYKRYCLEFKFNEWEKRRATIRNSYTERENKKIKGKVLNIIKSKG